MHAVGPPHPQTPNLRLKIVIQILIEKNLPISRPVQFKPVLSVSCIQLLNLGLTSNIFIKKDTHSIDPLLFQ